MTLQRIFFVVSIVLFGAIGLLALNKKQKTSAAPPLQAHVQESKVVFEGKPIEIDLKSLQTVTKEVERQDTGKSKEISLQQPVREVPQKVPLAQAPDLLPDVDRIHLFFEKNSPLSIVETIHYKSRVSWKSNKSAWLVDYAAHYKTPIDFIARSLNTNSLNEAPEYTLKSISDGQSFNILRNDKDFSFHLLVDVSRCKMWLYVFEPTEQLRYLMKTYRIALGRLDPQRASGCLTPLGTYKLGSRVATFKPKMMGMHRMKRVELMRVFGTRWIPFEREVSGCTEPAKGFGIHGTPWAFDDANQTLVDDSSSIGGYESDGCIRLKTEDMEELYSIISTRSTTIELVRDVSQAKLPYQEKTG